MYLPSSWSSSTAFVHLQLAYDPGDIINNRAGAPLTVAFTHIGLIALLLILGLNLPSRLAQLGAGLALGGLVGNWIDLMVSSHRVVDFISVGNWMIFNLADFSILIGIGLIVAGIYPALMGLRSRRSPERQADNVFLEVM
jgi:signal peptidase II